MKKNKTKKEKWDYKLTNCPKCNEILHRKEEKDRKLCNQCYIKKIGI